jgi:hypothetical protein
MTTTRPGAGRSPAFRAALLCLVLLVAAALVPTPVGAREVRRPVCHEGRVAGILVFEKRRLSTIVVVDREAPSLYSLTPWQGCGHLIGWLVGWLVG